VISISLSIVFVVFVVVVVVTIAVIVVFRMHFVIFLFSIMYDRILLVCALCSCTASLESSSPYAGVITTNSDGNADLPKKSC